MIRGAPGGTPPTEDLLGGAGVPGDHAGKRELERRVKGEAFPPSPPVSVFACFENKNENIWHLENTISTYFPSTENKILN